MLQLAFEAFIVGILNIIVGFIVSYISMGNSAKNFQHWNQLLLTFFISGVLIHLLCEVTGLNKRYCKSGNACQ
jgi:hypothetical protein